MAEYIERKGVINRIKEYTLDVYDIDLDDAKQFGGNSRIENYCEGLYEATELVDDIPAADVAPVRHGRWLCVDTDTEQFFLCNRCKKKEYWESDYCPNCGCLMDGGDDE